MSDNNQDTIKKGNGLAIASLVLGILGLLLTCLGIRNNSCYNRSGFGISKLERWC